MKKMFLTSSLSEMAYKIPSLINKPCSEVKFIYIITATNVYENKDWFFKEIDALNSIGFNLIKYDIAGKNETEVKDVIKSADVVCVTGGNTYYLLEQMNKCHFKSIILPYLESGGLYIGCSAGSIVACPEIGFIGEMDDKNKANLQSYKGLELVQFNIMPHADHPYFSTLVKELIDEYKNSLTPIIGLKDSQALMVCDNSIEFIQKPL
jgi:dipeptidase E